MSVIRRPTSQTPNRLPYIWEIWELDLKLLRTNSPELDADPDKPYRPYLVISHVDFAEATNKVSFISLSSNQFIDAFEILVPTDSDTNLKNDSWAHCHSLQTLSVAYLNTRIGILKSKRLRKLIIDKLTGFIMMQNIP